MGLRRLRPHKRPRTLRQLQALRHRTGDYLVRLVSSLKPDRSAVRCLSRVRRDSKDAIAQLDRTGAIFTGTRKSFRSDRAGSSAMPAGLRCLDLLSLPETQPVSSSAESARDLGREPVPSQRLEADVLVRVVPVVVRKRLRSRGRLACERHW